jgi:hypothetical protein
MESRKKSKNLAVNPIKGGNPEKEIKNKQKKG